MSFPTAASNANLDSTVPEPSKKPGLTLNWPFRLPSERFEQVRTRWIRTTRSFEYSHDCRIAEAFNASDGVQTAPNVCSDTLDVIRRRQHGLDVNRNPNLAASEAVHDEDVGARIHVSERHHYLLKRCCRTACFQVEAHSLVQGKRVYG